MDAAVSAFRRIQERLGPYPYGTFKIVQSAGGYGMESPRLIWIPYGVASANLRYLVTHETAHQWFYGLVGNDQARQPFADEAAADFVARYMTGTKRSSRCAKARLDRKIYDYGSTCYYEVIYIQGGNLIDAARKQMGSTRFWSAMRSYVDHQPLRVRVEREAARRARRRDAPRPRIDPVRAALPAHLLRRGAGVRRCLPPRHARRCAGRRRGPAASRGTRPG